MALGQPRGYGVGRFSPETPPMKLWFYEYAESNGTDVSFKMLVLILGKWGDESQPEKYEGHLWFSSGDRLTAEYTVEPMRRQ